PRPTRPTLLPYTTLFRSLEEARELTRQLLTGMQVLGRVERAPDRVARPPERTAPIADEAAAQQSKTGSDAAAGGAAEEPMVLSRSEEHTSELQSLTNIVC